MQFALYVTKRMLVNFGRFLSSLGPYATLVFLNLFQSKEPIYLKYAHETSKEKKNSAEHFDSHRSMAKAAINKNYVEIICIILKLFFWNHFLTNEMNLISKIYPQKSRGTQEWYSPTLVEIGESQPWLRNTSLRTLFNTYIWIYYN